MSQGAKGLVDRCRERLGDGLRTVTVYDDDGFETVYVREDLEPAYSRQRFASLVAIARDVHRPLTLLPEEDADLPIGGYRSSVHSFENARVIQVIATPGWGILVSVDGEAAGRLEEVADRLRGRRRRS